jgi:hypothetical protein
VKHRTDTHIDYYIAQHENTIFVID